MNVTCPNCATIYRVDPRKVPPEGVRARCAVCSAIFPVSTGATAASGSPAPAVPQPAPEARLPVAAPPEREPPARVEAEPAPAPEPPAPPPAPAPAPMAAPPELPRPVMAPPAARSVPPSSAPSTRPMAPPPAMPRPAGIPVRPAAAPAPRAPAEPRKQINPFLSQDPSQKARRLARALISDMVVYHPAKRREGLRDGTLKTLFDEEIKKSWEEYLDQVGRELAESTNHFKDALNEILADGRQIF